MLSYSLILYIFYKNIESEICKILRIWISPRLRFRKGWLFWVMKIIASSHGKNTQQNEETCIGYSKWSVLKTVRLTVHEIHIYSRQEKKWTKPALPSLTGLLPQVESSGWGTERQLFSSRAAERRRQAKIKMEDFLKHSKVLMLCFVLLCFDRS